MSTDWDALTKKQPDASSGPMNPPQDLRATVAAIQIPEDIRKILVRENLPVTNDGVLLLWDKSKKFIQEATAFEMEVRKLTALLYVPQETRKEGVNNVELGNGFVLKATLNLNRKLVSNKEGVSVVDAVDDCIDDFAKLDNQGSFIGERLFKWSVDISVTELRLLEEDAKTSVTKAALLKRVQEIMEVTDKAPTLEIKAPKVKK